MRTRPWCSRGRYALLDELGRPAGRLGGDVYFAADFGQDVGPTGGYDGLVRGDPPTLLGYPGSIPLGVIDGLTLHLASGQRRTLVPLPTEDNPNLVPRIEDADQFRAALELADALDDSDPGRAADVRRRIELAAFYQCPSCANDPVRRDDCALCQGDGFVPEDVAPGA